MMIWLFGLLPLLQLWRLWQQLSAQIPLCWNLRGGVAHLGTREEALWVCVLLLLLNGALCVLRYGPCRKERGLKFMNACDGIRIIYALFFGLTMVYALQQAVWIQKGGSLVADNGIPVLWGLALCICATGNFMPVLRQNRFLGIRTACTLADEENWRRTHSVAGGLWFFGGLLMLCAMGISSHSIREGFLTVIMLVLGLVPIGYSYFLDCKKHKNKRNRTQNKRK